MRTITLELLRHGPAHNQLLSPLTPYHALCGNHSGTTIHVPFEHNQFLHRLRALSYELDAETTAFQLQDTARALSGLLALVPGLAAEFAQREDTDEPLHLRLVTSASELALLPFELALSPPGQPGAGQPLLLQSETPVCLTRETRRVVAAGAAWPSEPLILFAWAAPDGSEVPAEAHLLALRQAIEPWVRRFPNARGNASGSASLRNGRRAGVDDHMTVLPYASIGAIEEACANREYTHIHILAHGVGADIGEDHRFALKLHGERPEDGADFANGERLAAALAAVRRPPASGFVRSPIVTLAACCGSNVGTVAGAGASIAHALSGRGFPLVVASQFPLSSAASVRMVEVLYEGLLWGVDPRLVLVDLRRRLFAEFSKQHEWASITAYTSFPSGFDDQLRDMQIGRAFEALDVAFDFADAVTRASNAKFDRDALEASRLGMQLQTRRLQSLLGAKISARQRARIHGHLASTGKREAELLWIGSAGGADLTALVRETLHRAKSNYWLAFEHDHSQTWAVVQYLSLRAILGVPSEPGTEDECAEELVGLWQVAFTLSRRGAKANDEQRQWALSNIVELALLAQLLPLKTDSDQAGPLEAVQRAEELLASAGSEGFAVYSTLRQLKRYTGWYAQFVPGLLTPKTHSLADRLIHTLSLPPPG